MSLVRFNCNICNKPNELPRENFDREKSSCEWCGSNVRIRALMHALSMELFGHALTLPDFPRIKSLTGIGLSDSEQYSARLAEKFDYRNTFYATEPHLDITQPRPELLGSCDFLISSEVFEHVESPVEAAFEGACRLLKPNGILLLTVPYSLDAHTVEHFPELGNFGLAQVGDQMVLVNRTAAGKLEAFENLAFHFGRTGPALEIRELSEAAVRAMLLQVGFTGVHMYAADYPAFGIINRENWSLPFAARKEPFALSRESAREVLEQWAERNASSREWAGNPWVRLGAKCGLLNLSPLLDSQPPRRKQ